MGAIGHLGDDGCVMKLTPLVRAWPGESQHARAVFGLECLRGIGSSTALMSLSGIAQKLKFKGLKAKAEEFVTEIAQERGLTRSELEDRVVPDCGLDEQGRITLVNPPAEQLLGGDRLTLAGKPITDTMPALQPLVQEAVGSGQRLTQQEIVLGQPGKERTLSVRRVVRLFARG